jgi:hypothetical protein
MFQTTNQIMIPSCFLFHTISIVSLLCIQQYLTSFHGFIHQRQSLDPQPVAKQDIDISTPIAIPIPNLCIKKKQHLAKTITGWWFYNRVIYL